MNTRLWNRRLLILLLAALLPLAVGLMLSLRDFVREAILVPLSYLFWIADLLIRSTPQALFWALLVITGLIIAVRSLYVVSPPPEKVGELETRATRRQRVGFWTFQMHMLRQGVARARFADFLSRLGLEVLAFREQITPVEAEARLQNGEFDAPEILAFLRIRRMVPSEGFGLLPRLVEWLGEWKNRLLGQRNGALASSAEDELRRTVEYLEDQLEVKHDIWTNHGE